VLLALVLTIELFAFAAIPNVLQTSLVVLLISYKPGVVLVDIFVSINRKHVCITLHTKFLQHGGKKIRCFVRC